ncbi:hypothetical protein [Cohnella sp. GCM10012308]|uniref:hypothetical protein n=1 Tax=Cohnella sp. GCM10012308 TaxID=3317329 RepID=UPI003621E028
MAVVAVVAAMAVMVVAMFPMRLAAAFFATLFGMRLAATGCKQHVFLVSGQLLAHDFTPPYDKDDPVYEGQLRSDRDNGTIWAPGTKYRFRPSAIFRSIKKIRHGKFGDHRKQPTSDRSAQLFGLFRRLRKIALTFSLSSANPKRESRGTPVNGSSDGLSDGPAYRRPRRSFTAKPANIHLFPLMSAFLYK